MTAALLLTALPVGVSSASAAEGTPAPQNGLVAEYLFDQTSGTTVANTVTGSVGDATVVNGTDAQWTGTSLTLSGGAKSSATANWVRLPDNIVAGKNSATITIETKLDPTMKSTYNFIWNIGNDATTQYWFASARDAARTAITASSNNGEANARSSQNLDANRWYSLTSVIDGDADTISFYVDGKLVGKGTTTLSPASITNQTLNAIGRSPWPDPFYKGEVSTFRVYDRALSGAEVATVSSVDGALHEAEHKAAANTTLNSVAPVTLSDTSAILPNYGGAVTWSSGDPAVTIAADGVTATVRQPALGQPALSTTLTATATVRGQSSTKSIPTTVKPTPGVDTPYGYVLVHFIEDSAGYAEKIYLDVSRGDNPEQWDPLNGGKPILASDLGTTGIRDPYLTYNPETETYYIIATDLRVFGGDGGSGSCTSWCYWTTQGSTKLNIWESKDLITWGEQRQIDMAADSAGVEQAELGMAWAPEATWVPDYNGTGEGAFVVYWSSNVYTDAAHTSPSYNRVVWGATTDFTQATYEYGGDFVNTGGNTIDTTIIQDDGKTYRITKDNSAGKGLYMEVTAATDWWEPTTTWTTIQTRIGAEWAGGNAGGVEGPAVFKRHDADAWYLYVDVIPSTGYRPMQTTDLDAGWTRLISSDFSMAPSTKHGGVVSITKGQYDAIRGADATAATETELGSFDIENGATAEEVRDALPATAEVTLAYARGTGELPVDWDLSEIDTATAGTHQVTGVVRSIGANLNQWTGAGGSTAWNAPDKKLFSSTAIRVTAELVVGAAEASVDVVTTTRCVAGKVALVASVTNPGDASAQVSLSTPYGSKSMTVAAGKTASAAFSSRLASIPAGQVTGTAEIAGASTTLSAPVAAASCG